MGGQRVGEEKNELGFALDRCVWAFLFNRKERTTVRSNPTAWKATASSKRVVGRVRLGYRSSGAERMPHRGATHAKQAVGRVKLWVKLVFSVISFTDYSFCSDFEQISYSFFYSNYSNENLIREFKSYRNISGKFKVNEFYSCFRCK
jgi:hypothetical protein